jgi:ABC-type dipeptide/oligopeptide/nickel transport system permease subunit
MIGTLIVGLIMLIIGIFLRFFSAYSKKNARDFSPNIFVDIIMISSLLSLAKYCLQLMGEDINLRNGIFIGISILSIDYAIYKLIEKIVFRHR